MYKHFLISIITIFFISGSLTLSAYNGSELLQSLIQESQPIIAAPDTINLRGIRIGSPQYPLITASIRHNLIYNDTIFIHLRSEFTRDSVRDFVLRHMGIDLDIYGSETLDAETWRWILDTILYHTEKNNTRLITNTQNDIKELINQYTDTSLNNSDTIQDQLNDPYADIIDHTDQEFLDVFLYNRVEGIGVIISHNDSNLSIDEILPGGPADTAGLVVGDTIIQIGDHVIRSSDTLDGLRRMIIGKSGSSVTLTIQRGTEKFKKTITRAKVHFSSMKIDHRTDKSSILTIRNFPVGGYEDFKPYIRELRSRDKIIIDLRHNGGGNLEDLNKILNHFIPRGQALYHVYRTDNIRETITSEGSLRGLFISKPKIIFLTDRMTASAAEMMAGIIREYYPSRVQIIGEQTFGKGTMQTIRSLDTASLKLTTAQWSLGRSKTIIDGIGLTPDYNIIDNPLTPDDETLEYALRL